MAKSKTHTSKVGKPVATVKKVTHAPPEYPGWTQSPKRHLGTKVPPTPKGKVPPLKAGKVRPGPTVSPFYNVPKAPGKAHSK